MSHYTPEEAALAAASDAADAVVELLRYAREGDYSISSMFADEVATKLAAALALVIELEADAFTMDEPPGSLLANIKASLDTYLLGEGREI